MSGNELEVLEHYNKKMKKYEEHPDVLLRCLTKLDQVRVNISLLQVGTEISHAHNLFPIAGYRNRQNGERPEKKVRGF